MGSILNVDGLLVSSYKILLFQHVDAYLHAIINFCSKRKNEGIIDN